VLVLVLVLVRVLVRVRVRGSAAHLAEHRDGADDELFGVPSFCRGDIAGDGANVDECAAFHGRSASDGVCVSSIGRARFARSLGDIERDRHRGGFQLLSKFAFASWKVARDSQCEVEELDRAPIDIQVLVVQTWLRSFGHASSVGPRSVRLRVSRTRTRTRTSTPHEDEDEETDQTSAARKTRDAP
jgi:hypothetical protein